MQEPREQTAVMDPVDDQTNHAGGWLTTRRLAAVFAGTTAVLVATILFLSYQLFAAHADERARVQVERVAREFSLRLTTYRYDTLTSDIKKVKDLSTGSFKKDYEQALGGETFRKSLGDVQGTSQGKIISVSVVSVRGDEASATAVVEQTINNNQLKEPKVRTNRLELSLVRTSSGWKIDRTDKVTEL